MPLLSSHPSAGRAFQCRQASTGAQRRQTLRRRCLVKQGRWKSPTTRNAASVVERNNEEMSKGDENVRRLMQQREDCMNQLRALDAALIEAQVESFRDSKKSSHFLCDYGFFSENVGVYAEDTQFVAPDNIIQLAIDNFLRELEALRKALRGDYYQPREVTSSSSSSKLADQGQEACSPPDADARHELRAKLDSLRLNDDNVWARERSREPVKASLIIKVPYLVLCAMLDKIFVNRPISRFWFLETVARMPYFSYISMLHLYETLGWFRVGASVKRVHFAEEWNEFHHLLIMESLGGDQKWVDRFMAQHAAVIYYWILVLCWIISPPMAYNFSELIECHAVDTYSEFVDANEDLLRSLPPPRIAKLYYDGGDLYMFDEFQTSEPRSSRRPKCENLYDVFCNIRDDEGEHVKTMAACRHGWLHMTPNSFLRGSDSGDSSTRE